MKFIKILSKYAKNIKFDIKNALTKPFIIILVLKYVLKKKFTKEKNE